MNCQHIRQGMAKNSETIRLGRLHSVQCWLSAAIHSLSVSSKWAIQEVLPAVLLTFDSSFWPCKEQVPLPTECTEFQPSSPKSALPQGHTKKNIHSAKEYKRMYEICLRWIYEYLFQIVAPLGLYLWMKQSWTGAFWWNRFERIDQMAWQTFFIPLILPFFLASLLDLASEQDEQVPPKAVLPPRDSETHVSQKLPGMHLCAWWRLWLLKAANRDFIIWFYATATLKPQNMTFQAIQARAAKEVFMVK